MSGTNVAVCQEGNTIFSALHSVKLVGVLLKKRKSARRISLGGAWLEGKSKKK